MQQITTDNFFYFLKMGNMNRYKHYIFYISSLSVIERKNLNILDMFSDKLAAAGSLLTINLLPVRLPFSSDS